jgi:hypothetical protein
MKTKEPNESKVKRISTCNKTQESLRTIMKEIQDRGIEDEEKEQITSRDSQQRSIVRGEVVVKQDNIEKERS